MRSNFVIGSLLVCTLSCPAWAVSEDDLTPQQLECIELSKVVNSTLKLIDEGSITATPQQLANLKLAQSLAEQGRECEARPFTLGLKGAWLPKEQGRSE